MDKRKVVSLAELKNDNTLITPMQTLRDVMQDLELEADAPEDFQTDGLIVVKVMRLKGRSHYGFYLSNVQCTEAIGFIERFKADIIRGMDAPT